MIPSSFARRIAARVASVDEARRALQGVSSSVLSTSKRAIFAFHRDRPDDAHTLLDEAKKGLSAGTKIVKKEPRVAYEGAWRAAQEEYTEAALLAQYLSRGTLEKVDGVAEDPEIFLGGLSDLTGELLRYAVLLAGHGDRESVERILSDVTDVVEFLLEMDLTGHLRTKVDQSKQNLRKLEEIRYDLSMRDRMV